MGWESGATTLPAAKKSLEWPFLAVKGMVSFLFVLLFMTTRTNVLERNVRIR